MTGDLHPVQIQILRRMSPAERLERGLNFLRMTREWLAAGVRQRNPAWTEQQIAVETRRLIDHARD